MGLSRLGSLLCRNAAGFRVDRMVRSALDRNCRLMADYPAGQSAMVGKTDRSCSRKTLTIRVWPRHGNCRGAQSVIATAVPPLAVVQSAFREAADRSGRWLPLGYALGNHTIPPAYGRDVSAVVGAGREVPAFPSVAPHAVGLHVSNSTSNWGGS